MIQDYTFTAGSFQVGPSFHLRLPALLGYLQEAAGRHAAELGVSVATLQAEGWAWFLARLTLEVHRWPQSGEVFTVRTWPSGGDKLYQYREFEVRDAQENTIARAGSAWLVVSLSTRKLIPLPPPITHLPAAEPLGVLAKTKLRWSGEATLEQTLPVLYHDLDPYGHVNNSRYVLWGVEALPWDWLEKHAISYLDIRYLQETHQPGTVSSQALALSPNRYLHRIVRAGEVLTLMETHWK